MKLKILSVIIALTIVGQVANACTVISCALKGEVFAAANEDDYMGFARMWLSPRTADRYGSICFGLPDLQAQAAMNEYGLFYDFTAQNIDASKYNLKNIYKGDLFFEILGKCKTVPEVLKMLEKYDYSDNSQVLIADALGNSVIINVGTKVVKTASYQINTNFNIAALKTGKYSCRRYDISEEALKDAKTLSVPFLRDILSHTRQEGKLSTIYSNIYDLKRGIVYIYNFHDFNKPYVIDLKKELARGYRLEKISSHFPVAYAYESFLQLDPAMFRKEMILDEIGNKGLNTTIDRYFALANDTTKKDSKINGILLEVSIQLIKEAYNRHANGGPWEYWFGFAGGFKNERFTDERLTGAERILDFLNEQKESAIKLKNFIFELKAYLSMLKGDGQKAKDYYKLASLSSADSWPVSYNRAQKMALMFSGK
ncbi:hypothetical protein TH53_16725 [Pedobacter lusitanus]|uniref:Uncharacterized protein n=1 Tax=Pedobacter lusitanus TaxID=1503925 RepID=A0A0D0GNN3_9SPHI|nr:hypothetical protein [Pedobacter lusitanus]KIO76121.1 hypothetical protein TH53_16725 [Pedobacter lusitanus]